jgi:hypothetical protein
MFVPHRKHLWPSTACYGDSFTFLFPLSIVALHSDCLCHASWPVVSTVRSYDNTPRELVALHSDCLCHASWPVVSTVRSYGNTPRELVALHSDCLCHASWPVVSTVRSYGNTPREFMPRICQTWKRARRIGSDQTCAIKNVSFPELSKRVHDLDISAIDSLIKAGL